MSYSEYPPLDEELSLEYAPSVEGPVAATELAAGNNNTAEEARAQKKRKTKHAEMTAEQVAGKRKDEKKRQNTIKALKEEVEELKKEVEDLKAYKDRHEAWKDVAMKEMVEVVVGEDSPGAAARALQAVKTMLGSIPEQ